MNEVKRMLKGFEFSHEFNCAFSEVKGYIRTLDVRYQIMASKNSSAIGPKPTKSSKRQAQGKAAESSKKRTKGKPATKVVASETERTIYIGSGIPDIRIPIIAGECDIGTVNVDDTDYADCRNYDDFWYVLHLMEESIERENYRVVIVDTIKRPADDCFYGNYQLDKRNIMKKDIIMKLEQLERHFGITVVYGDEQDDGEVKSVKAKLGGGSIEAGLLAPPVIVEA